MTSSSFDDAQPSHDDLTASPSPVSGGSSYDGVAPSSSASTDEATDEIADYMKQLLERQN